MWLEQLAPFPDRVLAQELARYPKEAQVIWCQEEPRNMGAWTFAAPRIEAVMADVGISQAGPVYAGLLACIDPGHGGSVAAGRSSASGGRGGAGTLEKDVTLDIAPEAVREIARIAAQVNESVENIGARRLQTVMEKLLEELSFEAEDRAGESVSIDAAYVRDKLAVLAQDVDLSKYIL